MQNIKSKLFRLRSGEFFEIFEIQKFEDGYDYSFSVYKDKNKKKFVGGGSKSLVIEKEIMDNLSYLQVEKLILDNTRKEWEEYLTELNYLKNNGLI